MPPKLLQLLGAVKYLQVLIQPWIQQSNLEETNVKFWVPF